MSLNQIAITKSTLEASKIFGWVQIFAVFGYVLVCGTRPKQFKLWLVPAEIGSLEVGGELACCALLKSMFDLKATQMNVQCSLIRKLMLYGFEPRGSNQRYLLYEMRPGTAVGHSIVSRWFKIFRSGSKILDDQARWGRPKIVDSEAVL